MEIAILGWMCLKIILLLDIASPSDLSPTHSYGFDTKVITENKENKIIAGVDTFPGEFPWQVSLQVVRKPYQGTFHFCGGSILDAKKILTAAHCLADFNLTTDFQDYNLQVHSGIQHIRTLTHFDFNMRQVSLVESIIIHPRFDKNNANNDLAILILSTPFVINDFTHPLGLPSRDQEPEGSCLVSGWGFQTPENGVNDRFSDNLKKALVDIVDRKRCSEIYKNVNPVTDQMICGGRLKEGMATCIGDSGSPVACYDMNKRQPYLAGIVSWGINPCGLSNYPSVFSNVASLRQFVDSNR